MKLNIYIKIDGYRMAVAVPFEPSELKNAPI